jgi:hypothetical protein
MLRTLGVLLLLLGLATATPVVCLCAPSEAAGLMAGVSRTDARGDRIQGSQDDAPGVHTGAPSLIAASAAAAVAMLVATAAGPPSAAPWQLPRPVVGRRLPLMLSTPGGPSWSPAVPPPR